MKKNQSEGKNNITNHRRYFRALGALLLVLGMGMSFRLIAAQAAAPQNYAPLRLLMEALHEVDQKYVGSEKNNDLIYGAIRGMVMSLDSNSSFLTPAEYQEILAGKTDPQGEAGLELTLKDNILTVIAALEGGPGWRAGVQANDHILKINDKTARNMTPMEATKKLQGAPGSTAKLQILRNGMLKPLDIAITLEKLNPVSASSQNLEDNYLYIRLKYFNDQTAEELRQILKNALARRPSPPGFILDLRDNARGKLEQGSKVASTFLGDSLIYYSKGRQPEQQQSHYGKREYQVLRQKLPLVVIINDGTAEAAEIVAGALQAQGQAQLLGYKTFGKGSINNLFPLKDGSAIIITTAFCYTPKDQMIQGKGLEPDVAGPKKEAADNTALPVETEPLKPKDVVDSKDITKDPMVIQAIQLLKRWGHPRLTQKAAPSLKTEVKEGRKGR